MLINLEEMFIELLLIHEKSLILRYTGNFAHVNFIHIYIYIYLFQNAYQILNDLEAA